MPDPSPGGEQTADRGLPVGARVKVLGVPAGDDWLIEEGKVVLGELGTVTWFDPPRWDDDGYGVQLDSGDTWWFGRFNLIAVEQPQPDASQVPDG